MAVTKIGSGGITFNDGTVLNSATIPWGNLSSVPSLVTTGLKANGNLTGAGRVVGGGTAVSNCGHGPFPNCANSSASISSPTYLSIDNSNWDYFHYVYNCNCDSQCNCQCRCQSYYSDCDSYDCDCDCWYDCIDVPGGALCACT